VVLLFDVHRSHSADPPKRLCLPLHSTAQHSQASVPGCGIFRSAEDVPLMMSAAHVRRNPGKGRNNVEFGDIFAEATVGSAVSGFKSYGIFTLYPNQLPEHVFSHGIVHVYSEIAGRIGTASNGRITCSDNVRYQFR